MGVRVDATRHHHGAPGVDDLGALRRVETGAHRLDDVALDENVGALARIRVHHRAAANENRHLSLLAALAQKRKT